MSSWDPFLPAEDADDAKVAEVIEAIARGDAVVCFTRCWSCQFGECFEPPKAHTWMDKEDADHAGHPWPLPEDIAAKNVCACSCARGGQA